MNHLATLWTSLTWCQSIAVMAGTFLVILVIAIVLAHYFDPLKVEIRAIRRKRRKEQKLITKARAVLLRRHDPAADRNCYRELTR